MRLYNLGNLMKQNPLFSTYINEFPRVQSLFSYPGDKKESFQNHGRWLAENYRQDRSRLVDILSAYNRELGCGSETLNNLELLKDGTALAVITGQQAGVLTGPLFTIYKAITAIQVAKEMESQLKVPVVPVFWVAGEDHDFQEINHIYTLKGIGTGRTLQAVWGREQPEARKLALPG
ncbi:MAG TPA: bacillithiol biosynthesis BshC, partial [Bacillota bacterium]|nr:bacillithiol biosynthesis BshC [Bacillota bacterium]